MIFEAGVKIQKFKIQKTSQNGLKVAKAGHKSKVRMGMMAEWHEG